MKFLVIGNSVEETVTRTETGQSRRHIGGVGAIMARELALSGPDAEVTFLTTAAAGAPTEAIRQGLTADGVHKVLVPQGYPPQTRRAQATIFTRRGNPVSARGDWPPIASISPQIAKLAAQHDWTLVSANLTTQDLRMAAAHSPNLAFNGTTKKHALRITSIDNPAVVTLNHSEAAALAKALDTNATYGLKRATNAGTLMITMGEFGRSLYHLDEPPFHSSAPKAPANTDFIGTGDAATAGLVYALAHSLDINETPETVDRFIINLMERNAHGYERA